MNRGEYSFKEAIIKRFDNYIFPDLITYISDYLSVNEDKIKYYAKCKIDVNLLLDEIIKNNDLLIDSKNITTKSIMDILGPIIEGNNYDFK